jgi:hypothetical protein
VASVPSLRDQFLRALPHSILESFRDSSEGGLLVPAQHSEVGNLEVHFDEEITVCLGKHTHTHFSPWESESQSVEERIAETAADAAAFVESVLSDEWIIWSAPDGSGGCFTEDAGSLSELPGSAKAFRWSGPVSHDVA